MIDKTEEAVKTARTSKTANTVLVKAPTTIELQKNALPDAIIDDSANNEFITKLDKFFKAYI